jgi:ABC-type Zn2+ transport system substrate-binding protein/surface adhesin
MMRRYENLVRLIAAVSMMLASIWSPLAQLNAHSPVAAAQLAAQHQNMQEISDHGHSHDNDADDLAHAFHGHVHNAADHDHNLAFVIPRSAIRVNAPDNLHGAAALQHVRWGLVFDLDRPPRA